MRVFLDTNVLVSAFATRGLCADLVRIVLAEHELVTGDVVLDELRDVLVHRIGLPRNTVSDILALLRGQEVVPRPTKPSDVPVRDRDGRRVLASAVAGRVDVLVTGDRDLLDVADDAPLPIVDPRGFWSLLARRR